MHQWQLHCQTMPTSNTLFLRLNDFLATINTAFKDLRKDSDYTDVTLACEDCYQIEAHKVILTAVSPFFKELLKRKKHSHSLIYMRGIQSEDLQAIVDFLYYGEANICHTNLENFLKIAEELQLKGLYGSAGEIGEGYIINSPNQTYESPIFGKQRKKDTFGQRTSFISQSHSGDNIMSTTAFDLLKLELLRDMKEQDKKIKTIIGRSETRVRGQNKQMIKA